jgi:transcription antitermination protein NusB
MLSRRLIRIKVLQAVYAYYKSGSERPDVREKQLMEGFGRMYDLFVYELSFVLAVFDFAERRMEENKKKHLPSSEDLQPNTRFIENRIRQLLEANPVLTKEIGKRNIAWGGDDLLLRFYILLRDSDEYREYMTKEANTVKDDRHIIEFMLAGLMPSFDMLATYFEEMQLQWTDDYYHVLGLAQKYIQGLPAQDALQLPVLFKNSSEEDDNDDREFAQLLFRRTVQKAESWNELIAHTASNWELDRIAAMDMYILKIAICELTEFPSIPIKVTLNEYIEISKYFSTPRSKTFINGMLDKLHHELLEKGHIVKKGRGLMA